MKTYGLGRHMEQTPTIEQIFTSKHFYKKLNKDSILSPLENLAKRFMTQTQAEVLQYIGIDPINNNRQRISVMFMKANKTTHINLA